MALIPSSRKVRVAGAAALVLVLLGSVYSSMISMPGKSHRGPLPPLTALESRLVDPLRRDVRTLAQEIGERNVGRPEALARAADFIESELRAAGPVSRQTYRVRDQNCDNLEVELRGASHPEEIVIVGAHYDSVHGCPGANDNATGIAGMLGLARTLARLRPERTLRFVAFVNEEPPWFQTGDMGSRVYARRCRERSEKVVGMLSLETIGCYLDAAGTQNYPPPLGFCYPSEGNFIAFVANVASRSLVRRSISIFRAQAAFPSEGAALPAFLPGVGWSDHESFWQEGYPAIMVTDTAPFRYAHYHTSRDTADRIDYERCGRVVAGLEHVVRDLAGITP